MIIYKTTNLINGKIYVGQDSKNNPKYLGSGKLIKSAIKKYGKENFKKELLETCGTIEDLNNMEKYWIKELNTYTPEIGYNISFGGQSGWMLGVKHSEDTKNNFSLFRKGKLVGDKNGMYNKKHSEESKNKMSDKLNGVKNPFYGKKHSEETKNKMSVIAKMRITSPTSKRVIVGDVIFISASDASRFYGVSIGTATYRCRNKIKNWSYLEPVEP